MDKWLAESMPKSNLPLFGGKDAPNVPFDWDMAVSCAAIAVALWGGFVLIRNHIYEPQQALWEAAMAIVHNDPRVSVLSRQL